MRLLKKQTHQDWRRRLKDEVYNATWSRAMKIHTQLGCSPHQLALHVLYRLKPTNYKSYIYNVIICFSVTEVIRVVKFAFSGPFLDSCAPNCCRGFACAAVPVLFSIACAGIGTTGLMLMSYLSGATLLSSPIWHDPFSETAINPRDYDTTREEKNNSTLTQARTRGAVWRKSILSHSHF